jgi:hypothetical protein
MSRQGFVLFVALPVCILTVYVAARGLLSDGWQKFIYAENGPIELGTAACFASAGGAAIVLARRTRGRVPDVFRELFNLFAIACFFVALEEISYGQQLLGWKSPAWFEQNNHHGQTNLHNLMGNRPSHWLKNFANYATLIGFVIVPVIAMFRRGAYRPGHWTYYSLPRAELIVTAAIAQLCSFLWDAPKAVLGEYWHRGWNEVRELYWGIAALSYVFVMWQRLATSRDVGAGRELDSSPVHLGRNSMQDVIWFKKQDSVPNFVQRHGDGWCVMPEHHLVECKSYCDVEHDPDWRYVSPNRGIVPAHLRPLAVTDRADGQEEHRQ